MTNHATLLRESQIPGLSAIFASSSLPRKIILIVVFVLLTFLTLRDLESIVADYFRYPITVSVLVTESRVLPFPAVTVCNLNPVHRGRFCSSDLSKPENIEKILCASLTDLFQVCRITEALEDLVQDGKEICEGKSSGKDTKRKRGFKRRTPKRKNNGTESRGSKRRLRKPAGSRPSVRPDAAVIPESNDTTYFLPQTADIPADVNVRKRTGLGHLNPGIKRRIDRKIKEVKKTVASASLIRDSDYGTGGDPEDHQAWIESESDASSMIFPESSSDDDEDDYENEEDEDEEDADDSEADRTAKANADLLSLQRLLQLASLMRDISRPVGVSSPSPPSCNNNQRTKRETQLNLRTLLSTFKSLQAGDFSGGLLQPFTESGGLVDTIILQIASLYGINVNSTRELLPAIFMKAFTEVTGCSVGSPSGKSNGTTSRVEKPNPVNEALDNLTTIFQATGCIWKAPKLIKLFQETSTKLITQLTSCTRPWVNDLLGFNASSESAIAGETPWYILLDLLENWLANLSRVKPEKAIQIGHQSRDLIRSCFFAGKRCDPEKDFITTFHSQHGNCFTYSMNSGEAEKESLSGFTGPKFGLELLFNLEKDAYMPISREAGVKIVVHDRSQKADPDQDAINIAPGVVTYVGVQMQNISRLPAPYQDKCVDEWPDSEDTVEYRKWALALHHESYTIQVCLKICLQLYTIKVCKCWTSSALWPPYPDIPECTARGSKSGGEECVDLVRHLYYEEKIQCHCPPRCSDRIYERFLSTGQETRQCSAIQSEDESTEESEPQQQQQQSSADDKENSAKAVIYFHSLSFNEIHQDRKYTLEGLLGAIGGILGVYLGYSFFAFYEMFEIIVRGFFKAVRAPNPQSGSRPAPRPTDDRYQRQGSSHQTRQDPSRRRRTHRENR